MADRYTEDILSFAGGVLILIMGGMFQFAFLLGFMMDVGDAVNKAKLPYALTVRALISLFIVDGIIFLLFLAILKNRRKVTNVLYCLATALMASPFLTFFIWKLVFQVFYRVKLSY